ncbi:MAG: FAD-dependent oxidoreductase [Hyphomonadaceae bacterium]|nr:FAD-dependent oxidoreductase [Hyphomonadaceae bacterium]
MSAARVTVIGAGAVGLMCALRLAERGAAVTVIETLSEDAMRAIANGSLAAAGMLAPIVETLAAPDPDPDFAAAALDSFALWRAHADAAPWASSVRFEGGTYAAADPAEQFAFLAAAQALGADARPVETRWARCGVALSAEGALDPRSAHEGLIAAARAAGVRFVFGEMFDPRRQRGADVIVAAPGGARCAALKPLAPALAFIRPAKGHVALVVAPEAPHGNVHADGLYLCPRGGGALALGATMQFDRADTAVDHALVEEMHRAANAAFGGSLALTMRAWAGVRAMAPDWAPLIGPSGRDGVLVACGHSRNGWLLAPITAEIICAHVFGEALSPAWAPFRPDRFQTKEVKAHDARH